MEIGFLIPSYFLTIGVYGAWLFCRLVFGYMFDNSEILFYFWLATIVYLHVASIRTINSRYGYSEDTFKCKNKFGQWFIYGTGFPIVFLDWECPRNFSLFIAKTWHDFWVPLFFVKAALVGSVWAVLSVFMEYDNTLQYFGWLVFGTLYTIFVFINHPWVLKLYFLVFYFVPFIAYIILWVVTWPFIKIFGACWGKCCRKSSYGDTDSQVEHEGGEEDEESKRTDRDFGVDRRVNYRTDTDADRLETNAGLSENRKNKKKRRKGKKNRDDRPVDHDDNQPSRNPNKDIDLDEYNFFSRAWKCIQPKYCDHCDHEIRVHQQYFIWDVGHMLHLLKWAHVKWVGNKVWPIWVKPPATIPPHLDPNYGKENILNDEEVEIDNAEETNKPNHL